MVQFGTLSRIGIFGSILLGLAAPSDAVALKRSNIVVSWAGYPSSFVQEYTPAGTLVQSWTITSQFSSERARDVGVDDLGNIVNYNGTFSPFLTVLNPTTGVSTSTAVAGWNTANNSTWGTLAVLDGYAYAADQIVSGDGPGDCGIVRIKLSDKTAQRFRTGIEPTRISVGLNRMLYAVWPNTSPGQNKLDVIDTSTMALLKTIDLPMSVSGVTADDLGFLYATAGSSIYRLDPNGNVLASLTTPFALDNIKIAPDGQLISANDGGQIVTSTTALSSYSEFTLNEPGAQLFSAFAAFATPVPESETASVLAAICGAYAAFRRSRKPATLCPPSDRDS